MKKRIIYSDDEDWDSEEARDKQVEADLISVAEAGWLLGYSDYEN